MLQAGVSLFYTLKSFPQGVEKEKQNVKKFSTGGATFLPARLYIGQTGQENSSKPSASQSGSASDASTVLGEDVQIPNPWQDFESLEEAVKAVGFDFVAPDALAGCDKTAYQAITNEGDQIIEVLYLNGEERQVSVRKAPGSENISGMYTRFDQVEQVAVDGRSVTMSGDGETVSLATWTDGDYSFSVYADNGLAQGDMAQLVSQIH